jgi:glycosyltransferase involved in cell wall biosynthesis
MKTQVAFDLSGLAWQYSTGVQNLYWAFVDAYANQPKFHQDFDLIFYDRSGIFNKKIHEKIGESYISSAPNWWPNRLRRPMQFLNATTNLFNPKIKNRINHVWNWGIFNPIECSGSITIPDVIPLEYPQWFDKRFIRLTEKSLKFAEDNANYIFTISHDVKDRVVKMSGISENRIEVIYPGIDTSYFKQVNVESVTLTLRKYGLNAGGYLLSSGFLDPRKNLVRQLKAFEIALSRGLKGVKYAITGLRTSLSDEVVKIIESPAIRSNVVFLGYVPKSQLIELTSQAAAVMYCSIAEGFGLPIIEAMAVGAPVITSKNTSMQELGTSRAILVDPYDVDSIAFAIQDLVSQGYDDKIACIMNNKSFASKFTIENWLGGHLDAYMGKPSNGRWL